MDERVPLGRTDLLVPRLGIGAMTWGRATGRAKWTPAQLAYGPSEGAQAEADALAASLAAGVNLVDTAAMYSIGASERRVGELARGQDVIVATKFPGRMRASTDDLPRELAGSLARLGRGSVELYQHHFPSRRVDIPPLMKLMADAVDAGKVRAVGVSNYTAEQMRLAHRVLADRGIPLASNQVQYSLLHRKPETDGVLDACAELGVTLIAYMPLASGALTGKYSGSGAARPTGLFRRFTPAFRGGRRDDVAKVVALLGEIGDRHDATPAQVALRWLVENPLVLPIPGAKNGRTAESNAGALSFTLASGEVDALTAATSAWLR